MTIFCIIPTHGPKKRFVVKRYQFYGIIICETDYGNPRANLHRYTCRGWNLQEICFLVTLDTRIHKSAINNHEKLCELLRRSRCKGGVIKGARTRLDAISRRRSSNNLFETFTTCLILATLPRFTLGKNCFNACTSFLRVTKKFFHPDDINKNFR